MTIYRYRPGNIFLLFPDHFIDYLLIAKRLFKWWFPDTFRHTSPTIYSVFPDRFNDYLLIAKWLLNWWFHEMFRLKNSDDLLTIFSTFTSSFLEGLRMAEMIIYWKWLLDYFLTAFNDCFRIVYRAFLFFDCFLIITNDYFLILYWWFANDYLWTIKRWLTEPNLAKF